MEYQREPKPDEIVGLREAAEDIKGRVTEWRVFERGIQDKTWDPTEGARSVLGPG